MNIKQFLYTSYYSLTLFGLVVLALVTIYQGSLVVDHGKQIYSLKSEQQELALKNEELKTLLYQKKSLHSSGQLSDLSQYELISSPIVIAPSSQVASR